MTGHPTYKDLRKRWERARKNESAAYREEPKRRVGRAAGTAAALDAMFYATVDKVFADAFQAMQKYGYVKVADNTIANTGNAWKFRPMYERSAEAVYLSAVDALVQRGAALHHAAATVAVTYFIPGKTFRAVVIRLENAYRNFESERARERLKAQGAA
jgi:hypothetical protein